MLKTLKLLLFLFLVSNFWERCESMHLNSKRLYSSIQDVKFCIRLTYMKRFLSKQKYIYAENILLSYQLN